MVRTTKAGAILTMPKMPFPIEGFGESKGSGKNIVRWAPYKAELNSSNSSSFKLMPTDRGSVGKDDRCPSPVRNLVLHGTGSSYVVPAVLSYDSSNSENNEIKPWDSVIYLYPVIIPGTYSTVMSYALWYKKMSGDCGYQACKRWCRYWWGKVME